jgi:hypothetical protein
MSTEPRLPWVGQRAVAWVIDDAPVPADLAWTLVVIARRCDDSGRGSYQSTPTIAAKAGKSVKQTQREIVRLRELGLLLLGNQSLVAHLPSGQRPTVYDLPLKLKGPKPVKESRNPTGGKKESADTPPMEGTPPLQGTPPLDGDGTPPLQAPGTPPLEGDQRKPLNNPLNNPSLSPRVPEQRPPLGEDRERDGSSSRPEPQDLPHRLVAERGLTGPQADQVIAYIAAHCNVGGDGWWIKANGNDTLNARVAEALANLNPTPASDPRDDSPCSHPYHHDVARNCGPCWSEVKSGGDPFTGYEELRPDWWAATYRKAARQPSSST